VATATARLDRAAWTYPSGLASALEGRLLNDRATADLLHSESPQSLVSRLRQSLVFEEVADAADPLGLGERMTECLAGFVREFAEACPTDLLAELFLLPLEWEAFRGFLRARLLGAETTPVPGAATPQGGVGGVLADPRPRAAIRPLRRGGRGRKNPRRERGEREPPRRGLHPHLRGPRPTAHGGPACLPSGPRVGRDVAAPQAGSGGVAVSFQRLGPRAGG